MSGETALVHLKVTPEAGGRGTLELVIHATSALLATILGREVKDLLGIPR